MAVESYALTSLANLKTYLGITGSAQDTLLELLIDKTTVFIETYCGRRFKETTYTNEEYDGTGNRELLLNNYPVTSFNRLQTNNATNNSDSWETIDTEDYFRYDTEGKLRFVSQSFLALPQVYRSTFTAGYATIPHDLEWACLKMCASAYQKRLGEGVVSERLGDHNIVWLQDALMKNTELKEILNQYKRHYIV